MRFISHIPSLQVRSGYYGIYDRQSFFLIYDFYVLGLFQVSKVNCRGEARGPAARWSSVVATAGCTVECADSTQLVPLGPRTHQDRVIDSLLGSDPRLILCVKFQVVSIL